MLVGRGVDSSVLMYFDMCVSMYCYAMVCEHLSGLAYVQCVILWEACWSRGLKKAVMLPVFKWAGGCWLEQAG